MAKRKPSKTARLVSDARPTAANIDIPVFVPNDNGDTDIEIGTARLRYGTLVIEFKDTGASVAIQNAIARGVLIGFGTIMLQPDVVNEMYQGVVAKEELERQARHAAIQQAVADGVVISDDEGNYLPVDDSQDLNEILAAYIQKDDDAETERLVDEEHIPYETPTEETN